MQNRIPLCCFLPDVLTTHFHDCPSDSFKLFTSEIIKDVIQ